MKLCSNCLKAEIPPGNRRYCTACSPQASRIWKARERRRWSAEWRDKGRQGPPPYLDGWPSAEARRAYYRAYMRAWRRKRKNGQLSESRTQNS